MSPARSRRRIRLSALALVVAMWLQQAGMAQDHGEHAGHVQRPDAPAEQFAFSLDALPDTPLVDQHGRSVRFRSDLIEDRLVAINFIFTTCTTICPPMGAIFADLQRQWEERSGPEASFLSITVDPATDTPERLAAWAARFGDTPGWTLLSGEKHAVDDLLKKLGVFTALREDHAPIVLLGNAVTDSWTRAYGLATPDQLAAELERQALAAPVAETGKAETPAIDRAARDYFTDVELVDQSGGRHRFYSDLIAGRTVVINSFFAECADSCPLTHSTMAKIQSMLGDRVGRDVLLLSITVDPVNDSPEKLAAYARRFDAGAGWHFLTGDPSNVEVALGKLGQQVAERESHKSVFLVGNDATGLWKKAFALAPAAEVLEIVRSVVEDAG